MSGMGHSAEKDAPHCGSFPPAMSPAVRLTVGARYHVCWQDAGHDGLCVNYDGETWTRPIPPAEGDA